MGRNSESVAAEKDAIRAVYREIAEEYDERIPGRTPADRRFVETEMAFKRPGVSILAIEHAVSNVSVVGPAVSRAAVSSGGPTAEEGSPGRRQFSGRPLPFAPGSRGPRSPWSSECRCVQARLGVPAVGRPARG